MEDKCQMCKKAPAEIKCTIIVRGEKLVRKLCADCARTAGLKEQMRLTGKRTRRTQQMQTSAKKTDLVCSDCRSSFSRFVETGILGCPGCYDAFGQKLTEILKGLHSATYHKGRGPGAEERTLDIAQLKWKLSEAVSEEDFELAARLRDEIRQIEEETN